MFLDQILYEMEGQNPRRDADAYFFSIFGKPSMTATWGWRFEGHHLSLNLTLHGGEVVSSSPAFFGANPANDQPVAAKYLLEAKRRGTKVAIVNPYLEPGLKRYWVAWRLWP